VCARAPVEVLPSDRPLFPCKPLVHRVGLRNLAELILAILLPLLFRGLGPRGRPHARFVLGDVVPPRGGHRLVLRLVLLLVLRLVLRLVPRARQVRTAPCEDLGRSWRLHRVDLFCGVPKGD